MSESSSARSFPEQMFGVFVWFVILVVFTPSLVWIATSAIDRAQVRDAAVVLLFAVIFLMRERDEPARWVLRFGSRASMFLGGACLFAAASAVFFQPLFLMVALGLLAGGAILYLFGDDLSGIATGLAVAFSFFTVLIVIIPVADVPMRLFAGKAAVRLLEIIGAEPVLAVVGTPAKLILAANGRFFEVAPECNGFGLVSSCFLLALLLAFSRKLRILDKLLIVLLAPLVGLFSNALRILVIVLLAPAAGASGYAFMHEAVGITLFLATLALIWWLVGELPRNEGRPPGYARKSPIS